MPNHITAETHRRETKERLVRIETIVDRMEVHLSKLNDRTGKLEGWRSWMAGYWNRDLYGTPSSGTGVDVGTTGCIYYEGSGSHAYNKDVYLRSPEFTFNTDTIATSSYGYGSHMGTLYMGVYITSLGQL